MPYILNNLSQLSRTQPSIVRTNSVFFFPFLRNACMSNRAIQTTNGPVGLGPSTSLTIVKKKSTRLGAGGWAGWWLWGWHVWRWHSRPGGEKKIRVSSSVPVTGSITEEIYMRAVSDGANESKQKKNHLDFFLLQHRNLFLQFFA